MSGIIQGPNLLLPERWRRKVGVGEQTADFSVRNAESRNARFNDRGRERWS
jgi:hypothetical protein